MTSIKFRQIWKNFQEFPRISIPPRISIVAPIAVHTSRFDTSVKPILAHPRHCKQLLRTNSAKIRVHRHYFQLIRITYGQLLNKTTSSAPPHLALRNVIIQIRIPHLEYHTLEYLTPRPHQVFGRNIWNLLLISYPHQVL
jgi:hypothetical protein